LLLIGLASICVSVLSVVAASAAPSPQALYRLLLTRPFPDSALPQGFSSATISAHSLTAPERNTLAKAHRNGHWTGGVLVSVNGPDGEDAVLFSIWKTAGDAQWGLAHPEPPGVRVRVIGHVPGYTSPSSLFEFSSTVKEATGKSVKVGFTFAGVVVGNVIVLGAAAVAHSDRGNRSAALGLLRAGIKHLAAVQR
jgi:hypothetical protein